MNRRNPIDLVLSILACAAGFILSWPFWRDFEYWAESHAMWWIYFVVGYLMSVYVFYAFLGCMRTLFLHDALVKSGYYADKKSGSADKGETR